MKAFDSLPNAAADLRQLLWAENESSDTRDDDKLRHTEAKHAGAGKTLLGPDSGPGPSHYYRIGVEKIGVRRIEGEGLCGFRNCRDREGGRHFLLLRSLASLLVIPELKKSKIISSLKTLGSICIFGPMTFLIFSFQKKS